MNPFPIVKLAAELLVSFGAGAVVTNTIKVTTPSNAKLIQKIAIGVGGFVLSGMVGEAAVKYANTSIENGVAQVKDAKAKIEAQKKENPPTEDTTN
jgi:hypothetical protein